MPPIPPYARNLLTKRELDIIQLLPSGPTAIAGKLCISVDGVKLHLKRIRKKLNISTKAQLEQLAPQILASQEPISRQVSLYCPYCNNQINYHVIPIKTAE